MHEEEEHSAKEEQEEPMKVKRSRNSSSSSEGASSDVDPWTQLSDEVVLDILRLLTKKDLVTSSLISRRFRNLRRDESLWTGLWAHPGLREHQAGRRELQKAGGQM